MRADAMVAKWGLGLGLGLLAVTFVANLALDPTDASEDKTRLRHLAVIPWNIGLVVLAALALHHARGFGGRTRASLTLLALGVGGWAFGGWAWTYYNFQGVDAPYPSLADVGYVSFVVTTIAGMALLLAEHGRSVGRRDLAIAALFPALVAGLFYRLLIDARVDEATLDVGSVLNVAYPTGDAAFVALAGLTLYFAGPAIAGSLDRLAMALLVMTVADVTFILALEHEFYFTGGWVDQLYVVAIGAYARAVLRFERPAPAEAAGAASVAPGGAPR